MQPYVLAKRVQPFFNDWTAAWFSINKMSWLFISHSIIFHDGLFSGRGFLRSAARARLLVSVTLGISYGGILPLPLMLLVMMNFYDRFLFL
jgi:hypothetical protein